MPDQPRPVWFTDDDYEAVDTLSGYFRPGDLAYDWICSLQKRAHAAPSDPTEAVRKAIAPLIDEDMATDAVLRALGMPDATLGKIGK